MSGVMSNAPERTVSGAFSQVGRDGIEPSTFRFSGGRSYRLSYLPINCR
jgi:hypothetical protein